MSKFDQGSAVAAQWKPESDAGTSRAVAAMMLLAAGTTPVLAWMLCAFSLAVVSVVLASLGLAIAFGAAAWVRGTSAGRAAMVAGGAVVLLVGLAPLSGLTAASEAVNTIPDLAVAATLGCAGLAGCLAACLWLGRHGQRESGALGLSGSVAILVAAGSAAQAQAVAGSWDELGCQALALAGGAIGCVLMICAGFLMSAGGRYHPEHAAPPPPLR